MVYNLVNEVVCEITTINRKRLPFCTSIVMTCGRMRNQRSNYSIDDKKIKVYYYHNTLVVTFVNYP